MPIIIASGYDRSRIRLNLQSKGAEGGGASEGTAELEASRLQRARAELLPGVREGQQIQGDYGQAGLEGGRVVEGAGGPGLVLSRPAVSRAEPAIRFFRVQPQRPQGRDQKRVDRVAHFAVRRQQGRQPA